MHVQRLPQNKHNISTADNERHLSHVVSTYCYILGTGHEERTNFCSWTFITLLAKDNTVTPLSLNTIKALWKWHLYYRFNFSNNKINAIQNYHGTSVNGSNSRVYIPVLLSINRWHLNPPLISRLAPAYLYRQIFWALLYLFLPL